MNTAWSLSSGQSTLSQACRLVTAGLALLLIALLGVCCALTEHGGGAATPVASVSFADTAGQTVASAGCSDAEGHSTGEGAARRANAPSRAADKPVLIHALDEGQSSRTPRGARPAEQSKRSPAAPAAHLRSQAVLQV